MRNNTRSRVVLATGLAAVVGAAVVVALCGEIRIKGMQRPGQNVTPFALPLMLGVMRQVGGHRHE